MCQEPDEKTWRNLIVFRLSKSDFSLKKLRRKINAMAKLTADQIQQYREALQNCDVKVLETLTPEMFKHSYHSRCICGCLENVSVWSYMKNGHMNSDSLRYLISSGKLSVEYALSLLSEWFPVSGTNKFNGNDFEEVNRNIDILLELLTHPNHWELLQNWKDKEYETTFLHQVFYGHTSKDQIEKWARLLLGVGLDPLAKSKDGQTPFQLMVLGCHHQLIQMVPSGNVNDFVLDDYRKNRNLLLQILSRHRFVKKPEWQEDLYETIRILVERGVDLTYVDSDGRQVFDYLSDYGCPSRVWYMFSSTILPLSGKVESKDRPIYKDTNPSPFADFLYRNRFVKDQHKLKILAQECEDMILTYGKVDLEDTGWKKKLEYEDLANLIHKWGWYHTRVGEILRENDKSSKDMVPVRKR